MGSTMADQVVRDVVQRRIASDPQWLIALNEYRTKLFNGFFDQQYVDDMFQNRSVEYSLEDAYCFSMVHTGILTGAIARVYIEVGSTPWKDRATEMNNDLLLDLPYPFEGEFWGGSQGADGTLSWSDEIYVTVTPAPGYGEKHNEMIPPGVADLEVGTQSAVKTALQLMETGSLARWPYGSTRIRLFYVVDHSTFGIRSMSRDVPGFVRSDNMIQLPLWDMSDGE